VHAGIEGRLGPLMPSPVGLASRARLLDEMDSVALSFSYVCRRCDVWGRIPAGVSRRCWSCDRADRLERR
jgi:hypothetical protein